VKERNRAVFNQTSAAVMAFVTAGACLLVSKPGAVALYSLQGVWLQDLLHVDKGQTTLIVSVEMMALVGVLSWRISRLLRGWAPRAEPYFVR
jgi:hypothetical protein